MATLNYIQEHKQSPSAMKGVITYCCQKKKVTDPVSGRKLISGIHCSGETAYEEFMLTKQVYGKTGGVNFYQYTQSFASRNTISSADAHTLALEFAERAWPGHEVLVCTHCDTDNPHSHFVINSVSWQDGRKLRQTPAGFQKLRELNDELCLAHGYTVITAKPKPEKGMSAREYRAAEKGKSWKLRLMFVIDQCMRRARSRKEFEEEMHRLGYKVRWTAERKYITYTTPTGMKCRDNKLHEEKYLKEHMEYELRIREELFFAGAQRNEPTADRAGSASTAADTSQRSELAGVDGRGGEDHGMGAGGMEGDPAGAGSGEQAGAGRPGGHERSADAGAADSSVAGAAAGQGDAETGWEKEREDLIAAVFGGGPMGVHKEADAGGPDRAGDLGRIVGSAVGLLHRMEDLQNAPPVKDATTMPRHTDHKRRKKDLEKRRALGHKDNDHEEEQGYGGMKAPW